MPKTVTRYKVPPVLNFSGAHTSEYNSLKGEMARLPRGAKKTRKAPYSKSKCNSKTKLNTKAQAAHPGNPSSEISSLQVSPTFCEFSPDGQRLTFHLQNRSSYTISPAESSPEHFWGTIYSAEWSHPDARHDCTCAIKASDFLLRQPAKDDHRAEYRRPRIDFDREVRTFQNTKHRNILQMYDYWEWEGRGYIAMKKLKGSLGDVLYEPKYRDILDDLRCDEAALAELVRQVLTGLDHLHSRNIIYRDVKPDNLLISSHPRIKLADFGNVEFLPDDKAVARGLEGTTSYMSPEMRRGAFYNTNTDIWSFGITLLNLLFNNDEDFPNFEIGGLWSARTFAQKQCYTSNELKSFMGDLFLKPSDRPTAQVLLQHPFVQKADNYAFKVLFDRFPQQNLALPVLSQRKKPETPPPTPEQELTVPNAPESLDGKRRSTPPQLTPPVTPSPSPHNSLMVKLLVKQDVSNTAKLDCTKVTVPSALRRSPRNRRV